MEDNKFQREVLERLIVLETLLKQQDYKGLNEKVEVLNRCQIKNEQDLDNHNERIAKIEASNTWLRRTVIGAIILGAMAILFGI